MSRADICLTPFVFNRHGAFQYHSSRGSRNEWIACSFVPFVHAQHTRLSSVVLHINPSSVLLSCLVQVELPETAAGLAKAFDTCRAGVTFAFRTQQLAGGLDDEVIWLSNTLAGVIEQLREAQEVLEEEAAAAQAALAEAAAAEAELGVKEAAWAVV